MKLPAASSGVSVYRRIQQTFTASGGEFNLERLNRNYIRAFTGFFFDLDIKK